MNIDIVVNALAPPEELARLAVQAEGYGLGTVWTASYLASRDPWSNLVAAAQATRRIGLGAIAVNPYDTHPVRIATGLLTLNEYAQGRARIVVGGGGEALQALGIKPERRVRAVGECVQILQGVTPGTPFTFDGQIHRVQNYNPAWAKAPKSPIYVAVNKPQMLRMAARYGDGIMLSDLTPPICAERIGWVRNHLREFGRASAPFRYYNFVAWHVYGDRERARRGLPRWMDPRARPHLHRLVVRSPRDAPILRGDLDGGFRAQLSRRGFRFRPIFEMGDRAPAPLGQRRRSGHERHAGLLKLDSQRAQLEQLGRDQLQLGIRGDQHQRPAHRTSSGGTAPSGATSAITSRDGTRIRCAA